MVNEEKVKLMFKASVLEQRDLKKEIKEADYSAAGYVAYHIIVNILCFSAAFVLVLFLVAVCRAGFFLSDDFLNAAGKMIHIIISLYVILFVTVFVTTFMYRRRKYKADRLRLEEYRKSLEDIRNFYEEERKSDTAG